MDYVNVIIFSSKGERPDQNKMGCGDLDGDIYWINWRPEFVDNYHEKSPVVPENNKEDLDIELKLNNYIPPQKIGKKH